MLLCLCVPNVNSLICIVNVLICADLQTWLIDQWPGVYPVWPLFNYHRQARTLDRSCGEERMPLHLSFPRLGRELGILSPWHRCKSLSGRQKTSGRITYANSLHTYWRCRSTLLLSIRRWPGWSPRWNTLPGRDAWWFRWIWPRQLERRREIRGIRRHRCPRRHLSGTCRYRQLRVLGRHHDSRQKGLTKPIVPSAGTGIHAGRRASRIGWRVIRPGVRGIGPICEIGYNQTDAGKRGKSRVSDGWGKLMPLF